MHIDYETLLSRRVIIAKAQSTNTKQKRILGRRARAELFPLLVVSVFLFLSPLLSLGSSDLSHNEPRAGEHSIRVTVLPFSDLVSQLAIRGN